MHRGNGSSGGDDASEVVALWRECREVEGNMAAETLGLRNPSPKQLDHQPKQLVWIGASCCTLRQWLALVISLAHFFSLQLSLLQ